MRMKNFIIKASSLSASRCTFSGDRGNMIVRVQLYMIVRPCKQCALRCLLKDGTNRRTCTIYVYVHEHGVLCNMNIYR